MGVSVQGLEIGALLRSSETQKEVAEALSGAGAKVRAVLGNLSGNEIRILLARAPSMALIDIDMADPRELAALETLITSDGGLPPIIVTAAHPTLDGMRRLMRLGIMDVVPQPVSAHELLQAVQGAITSANMRTGSSPGLTGRVISFLKSSGGVGTTSLIVQGALGLAAERPKSPASICLLDLDLQFGSIALHLDLPQKCSLLDLAPAHEQLEGNMLRDALAHHSAGIDVLAAPPDIHPLEGIEPEVVTHLIATARREYATIFIDLPITWSAWSRAVLAASDALMLVMHPTVPAIRHARRQIETLLDEHLDGVPFQTALNCVRKSLFGQSISLRDAERALGRKIDHVIPLDEAVATATNVGQPLAAVSGGRGPGKTITKTIKSILQAAETAVPASIRRN